MTFLSLQKFYTPQIPFPQVNYCPRIQRFLAISGTECPQTLPLLCSHPSPDHLTHYFVIDDFAKFLVPNLAASNEFDPTNLSGDPGNSINFNVTG
jgi:hypothetical protein